MISTENFFRFPWTFPYGQLLWEKALLQTETTVWTWVSPNLPFFSKQIPFCSHFLSSSLSWRSSKKVFQEQQPRKRREVSSVQTGNSATIAKVHCWIKTTLSFPIRCLLAFFTHYRFQLLYVLASLLIVRRDGSISANTCFLIAYYKESIVRVCCE